MAQLPPDAAAVAGQASGRWLLISGAAALLLALLLFGYRAAIGTIGPEFQDEADKVAAMAMIDAGGRLYRDVFSQHGPFLYMVQQAYAWLAGGDFQQVRWSVVVFALAGAAAIAASPLPSRGACLWAAAAYLAALACAWRLQDFYLLTHYAYNGQLIVIAAAQMALPAFLGARPTRAGLAVSGAALACTGFTAYATGPAMLCLAGASALALWARARPPGAALLPALAPFALGCAAATAAVALWMAAHADYLGYIAYHFYLNQFVYAQFLSLAAVGGQELGFLGTLTFKLDVQTSAHSIALAAWCATALLAAWMAWRAARETPLLRGRAAALGAAALLLLACPVLLNFKGSVNFNAIPFTAFCFAAAALLACHAAQQVLARGWRALPAALLAGAAVVAGIATLEAKHREFFGHITPQLLKAADTPRRPVAGGIYELVRSITPADERILALVYNAGFYTRVDRLPASGHFVYSPWQALYETQPFAGHRMDICRDIRDNRPTVVLFDDHVTWLTFPMEQYAPCVLEILQRDYTGFPAALSGLVYDAGMPNRPVPAGAPRPAATLYFRNDLLPRLGIDASWMEYSLALASPPAEERRIRVPLAAQAAARPMRIGLMVRPQNGQPVAVDVRFRRDGAAADARIRAATPQGDAYHYVDVPDGAWSAMDISAAEQAAPLSVFASYKEGVAPQVCTILEYADGTRRFTPGCPLAASEARIARS